MIFQSLDFLAFFLIVFVVYWACERRTQNLMLVAASAVFYGYVSPWFLLLLETSALTDYSCALGIDRWNHAKRWFLWVSLAVNLGLLALLKYCGFFLDSVNAVLGEIGLGNSGLRYLDVELPVGISFYTFYRNSPIPRILRARQVCRG